LDRSQQKIYPFKFLDPYGQEDKDLFFGREEETDLLYKMVFETNILVVYGMSGTGKTSLIQCGLASKFPSYDWLGINVRKGKNINESLMAALHTACGRDPIASEQGSSSLNQLFKAIYRIHFKPIYIIFDQFEELYILGSEDEQKTFIQTVIEMQNVEQPVKLLFIIREEYLGHLYDFEKAVPQLLKKKLRVEQMNLNKIKQVITGATAVRNSNIKLRDGETDDIATSIFNKIRGKENTLTIQLPYLQVFLDKFYLTVTNDENRQADAVFTMEALNKMGDILDVMRDFLEEQVQIISRKLGSIDNPLTTETLWSVLSHFATLEGTREPISISSLADSVTELDQQMIGEIVSAFVDRRILLHNEADNKYELVHDSLAKKIAEKRTDEDIALLEVRKLIRNQSALNKDAHELLTGKQLNFIEPYLGLLKLTKEEDQMIRESWKKVRHERNKIRRTRKIALAGGSFLFVVMVILTVFAVVKERRARLSEREALDRASELRKSEAVLRQLNTELTNSRKDLAVAAANYYFQKGNERLSVRLNQDALLQYELAQKAMKDYPRDTLYRRILEKIILCRK